MNIEKYKNKWFTVHGNKNSWYHGGAMDSPKDQVHISLNPNHAYGYSKETPDGKLYRLKEEYNKCVIERDYPYGIVKAENNMFETVSEKEFLDLVAKYNDL